MTDFLQKTAQALEDCGVFKEKQPPHLLLAVSGGIDSMVMLHALYTLCRKSACTALDGKPASISVVSVDHNIRPKKQSSADALLVREYCRTLGIDCSIQTVERGRIAFLARQRGCGMEEAARFVRYTLLEKVAASLALCGKTQNVFDAASGILQSTQPLQKANVFVCLAHNKDDQLETLLQRFFQGASAGVSGAASCGIAQRRGIFCRPFLNIARAHIAEYAEQNAVPFREDATNADIAYYRNNVRHKIIPFLNKYLPGWDTAVLAGAEKAAEEARFIESLASLVVWKKADVCGTGAVSAAPGTDKGSASGTAAVHVLAVCTAAEEFFAAGFPVRIRSLYAALNLLGVNRRIPYVLLKDFANGQKCVKGSSIKLYRSKRFVYAERTDYRECKSTELTERRECADASAVSGYCVDIASCGEYKLPFGSIKAVRKIPAAADNKNNGDKKVNSVGPFSLPLRIRSRQAGDRIRAANGTHKTLKKLWNEWAVEPPHRFFIPVIEQKGELVCVWGSVLGYSNWYVKDCEQNSVSIFLYYEKQNTKDSA